MPLISSLISDVIKFQLDKGKTSLETIEYIHGTYGVDLKEWSFKYFDQEVYAESVVFYTRLYNGEIQRE